MEEESARGQQLELRREVKARNDRDSVETGTGRRNLVVNIPVEKREDARASD